MKIRPFCFSALARPVSTSRPIHLACPREALISLEPHVRRIPTTAGRHDPRTGKPEGAGHPARPGASGDTRGVEPTFACRTQRTNDRRSGSLTCSRTTHPSSAHFRGAPAQTRFHPVERFSTYKSCQCSSTAPADLAADGSRRQSRGICCPARESRRLCEMSKLGEQPEASCVRCGQSGCGTDVCGRSPRRR